MTLDDLVEKILQKKDDVKGKCKESWKDTRNTVENCNVNFLNGKLDELKSKAKSRIEKWKECCKEKFMKGKVVLDKTVQLYKLHYRFQDAHANVKKVLSNHTVSIAFSCISSLITFRTSLWIFNHAFRFASISSASSSSPFFGVVSISLSSVAAYFSWVSLQKVLHLTDSLHRVQLDFNFTTPHLFLSCLGSLIVFKIFGGRYRNVLPSDVYFPGSFAVKSSPATSEYANTQIRNLMQIYGSKFGCHTCGRHSRPIFSFLKSYSGGSRWNFHGDHQPPLKIASQNRILLPHCPTCSLKQANAVRSKSTCLISPSLTIFRLYYLWLPWPLLNFYIEPLFIYL